MALVFERNRETNSRRPLAKSDLGYAQMITMVPGRTPGMTPCFLRRIPLAAWASPFPRAYSKNFMTLMQFEILGTSDRARDLQGFSLSHRIHVCYIW